MNPPQHTPNGYSPFFEQQLWAREASSAGRGHRCAWGDAPVMLSSLPPLSFTPEAPAADEANNCSRNRIPPAPASIDWKDDIIRLSNPPPPPLLEGLRSSFMEERYLWSDVSRHLHHGGDFALNRSFHISRRGQSKRQLH